MIKARATLLHERPLYILGLSAINLEKLREGKPILVKLEELDGVGEVIIMFGETEAAIATELSEFIGPSTNVTGLKKDGH